MYLWMWRRLPGGLPGKLAGSLLLLLGVTALLFFVVFPRIEPQLPWNNVNVDRTTSTNSAPAGRAHP